jgi:hypothetical protein
MKKQLTLIATALLAVGMVSPVNATTFTVTNVDGDWTNATADPVGGVITITNSGAYGGLSTARWGTDIGNGQSGYDFVSYGTPFPVTSDGTPFAFGTFTHQNWPITAPSLTSINLRNC